MVATPSHSRSRRNDASLFCPHCLKRIDAEEASRRAHRESFASGAIDLHLLECPTCKLVLAAEVDAETAGTGGGAA